MQELLKTRKEVILMIVGGGPARESLEKTAREFGIEGSVRFTGMVLPEETKDYYQMADIFACASTSETQGLTYIEAMASGLPLVSVRFTGMVLPEETKDYYQMADIFACASTSETQGLTYIEAMASGLPLVCRKDDCLDGVLEEGDYYQMADIFACASTSETQGLTYIEAMASGLPLVCRKDDCLDGVLEEGENGFAYETLEEFAAGIVTLLDRENVYENAVRRSRQIAEEFGTKRFGARVESCYYHTLLKRRYEEYESFVICKEQAGRFKERCWARYGHARRIS